nr:1638_t:CDS:10 [Entrophospora candida]
MLKAGGEKHGEKHGPGDVVLYLGDIQDHVLTMLQNLNHYELILSRAHSNYLAQISIEITQLSNKTNEIINKLTVFATILLPMNVVTGLFGMNVKVPGRDVDDLTWFLSIVGALALNKWIQETINNDHDDVLISNKRHINVKNIPETVQKKQRPDEGECSKKWDLRPPKKVNYYYVNTSSPDLSENDTISRESTPCPTGILTPGVAFGVVDNKSNENSNDEDNDRYDAESLEDVCCYKQALDDKIVMGDNTTLDKYDSSNDFSLSSILRQYCAKKNTSPYDPAHSYILDLSLTSKIKDEFSHKQWSELLKRPDVVKKTFHHEIEPFIIHLFENNMDLSQARLKWDELHNVVAPEYKNEFSYKRNEWKKIRWWIQQVIGQFLDAFETFRSPLENNCNEREWTGDYIIPLIQRVLKLDGRCLVPWGEVSVLATQRRRNNSKDINTEKVTRSHQADFLCRYERNEIACGLVCGGPHAYDLTKYASDQFNLPRMMKDMLDDLMLKFYYANNHKLYIIGIQVYMTEVQIYIMEKREIYFLHHLKSFDLPISFSSYNSLKFALRTVWNIRGLVNSLIQEFDIILDGHEGFETPPRVSGDMKTQVTPPKQPKKK